MPGLENSGAKIGSSGQNSETTVAAAVSKTTQEAAINGGDNSKTEMLNGFRNVENGGDGEIFKKNMSDLVEILSKLNPMAEEFVPPSLANHHHHHNLDGNHDQNHHDNHFLENGFGFSTDNFGGNPNSGDGYTNRRKRNNFSQGKRRLNNRTSIAQREDAIRKTVYVSDIDLQVTEELLAVLFLADILSTIRYVYKRCK